jgi:hypothetical protein
LERCKKNDEGVSEVLTSIRLTRLQLYPPPYYRLGDTLAFGHK